MGHHRRHIHPPQRPPRRKTEHPGRPQQQGIGAADTGAHVGPHHRQHHEDHDHRRQDVPADPDQQQQNKGRHRRGAHHAQQGREQRIRQRETAAGHRQRRTQHHRRHSAAQNTQQTQHSGAPEGTGHGQFAQPQQYRPRPGQQQRAVHQQRQYLPHSHPEKGNCDALEESIPAFHGGLLPSSKISQRSRNRWQARRRPQRREPQRAWSAGTYREPPPCRRRR